LPEIDISPRATGEMRMAGIYWLAAEGGGGGVSTGGGSGEDLPR